MWQQQQQQSNSNSNFDSNSNSNLYLVLQLNQNQNQPQNQPQQQQQVMDELSSTLLSSSPTTATAADVLSTMKKKEGVGGVGGVGGGSSSSSSSNTNRLIIPTDRDIVAGKYLHQNKQTSGTSYYYQVVQSRIRDYYHSTDVSRLFKKNQKWKEQNDRRNQVVQNVIYHCKNDQLPLPLPLPPNVSTTTCHPNPTIPQVGRFLRRISTTPTTNNGTTTSTPLFEVMTDLEVAKKIVSF